jgi:hypothetical protein
MSESNEIRVDGSISAANLQGPEHRAAATAPNKAFWRTALQVGPTAALALLVILPEVLQSIVDGFGRQLPPELYAVLVTITGSVTLVAAIVARVMANPKVIAWTAQYAPFFAPQKK